MVIVYFFMIQHNFRDVLTLRSRRIASCPAFAELNSVGGEKTVLKERHAANGTCFP